jgi:hypothetical protein
MEKVEVGEERELLEVLEVLEVLVAHMLLGNLSFQRILGVPCTHLVQGVLVVLDVLEVLGVLVLREDHMVQCIP